MAVLGAGMYPWGKWGRGFVEYGVAAAPAALADTGCRGGTSTRWWARTPCVAAIRGTRPGRR